MNANGSVNGDGVLVSVPQAARLLGVSARTVWREIADHKLEVVHIRGCTRLRKEMVESLAKVGKQVEA